MEPKRADLTTKGITSRSSRNSAGSSLEIVPTCLPFDPGQGRAWREVPSPQPLRETPQGSWHYHHPLPFREPPPCQIATDRRFGDPLVRLKDRGANFGERRAIRRHTQTSTRRGSQHARIEASGWPELNRPPSTHSDFPVLAGHGMSRLPSSSVGFLPGATTFAPGLS